MNPLRLALVACLAGISLWGLFSLLDNLRKPELLRTQKVFVVKGCEPMETDEARHLCPQLFCEKALLESRAVDRSAQFQFSIDRSSSTLQLLGGRVHGAATEAWFACVLDNRKVLGGRLLEPSQLEALAAQDGSWSL